MGWFDKLFGSSSTQESESTSQSESSSTSESSSRIEQYLQYISEEMLARSGQMAQLPYLPNRGLQVAGFNDMQKSAFNSVNSMANAYGFESGDPMSTLPQEQTVGGITGYGTGDYYDETVANSDPDGLYANAMAGELFSNAGFENWKKANNPEEIIAVTRNAPVARNASNSDAWLRHGLGNSVYGQIEGGGAAGHGDYYGGGDIAAGSANGGSAGTRGGGNGVGDFFGGIGDIAGSVSSGIGGAIGGAIDGFNEGWES